jgi:predicted ATP-grasp superfamily ATP-dependent carboligase
MKILIFEWLTGGGLWHERICPDPASTIQTQGVQMLEAVTEDFLDSGVDVLLPIDGRYDDKINCRLGMEKRLFWATDDLPSRLAELAEQADHIMVVAPESNCCLLNCLGWLRSFSDKLISPDVAFARIAANKQMTMEHLIANGFRSVPEGIKFSDFQAGLAGDFVLPVVLKPIDGAGSEEVELISDWASWSQRISRSPECYRLEPFIDGTPVSVSVLCGPAKNHFLPATQQLFDQQPFGKYVGASYPIIPELARRATQLAERAIDAMPQTRGYVGIDMVLSQRSESDDRLVEINPRLTMSYLKLRDVCRDNLTRLMLDIACS